MPKPNAKALIQEAPIDTGEFGDFIDRSHKRRIAQRQSDHLPAERLASTAYQAAMRKLQRYTGIRPRGQQDINRAGMMMMQALQQVSQIEQGHEEELQNAAVELVLSLPEFKAAREAVQAGDLRLVAHLTAEIDLEGAQLDAENTTDREDLKIAQVAAELDLEVQKRKFLNMMIQGNAMAKLQAYHLMNDRLNAVDPRLANLYGVLTSVGEFCYWVFPEEMQKQGMGGGQGAGGSVRLRAGEDGVTEIIAQGITFPMLVHELVKGLMEYVSHDDDLDDDTRKYVQGQADTLNNELTDIQLGGAAWQQIVQQVEDQELLPYVYNALVKLPAGQFQQTMQAIMAGGAQGKQAVDNIVRQVRQQLDNQEESEAGGIVKKLLE